MARDYSKVSPKLWRSLRFRGLDTVDAKLFYVFVLTCEHQTSAGCFRLPDAYASSDLGWTTEKLGTARAALIAAELLVYDPATEEYFVPRWYRHNPTTNPKHIKGVERLISELDSDPVREAAEIEYADHRASRNPLDTPDQSLSNGRLANTAFMNGKR